jgi:beta-lactamase regulating signal transducer with metallopeptidase domain
MPFPHIFASAMTQALLGSLWQGALLALLAALLLAALARSSAALRHAVGMVLLLAMALLPLYTVLSLLSAGSVSTAAHLTASTPHAIATMDLLAPGAHLIAAPTWLPWLWFAGVVPMLRRLVGGGWMVRTLDRRVYEMPAPIWLARIDALRHAMGIRRDVAVRLLRGVGLPCSARVWRPVIWLPISMLTRLTAEQIEALLAHELAHIRRLDWIWNGLQRVIEALLFYQPCVWWLSRRIRQERENACDDLAVSACGDALVLAEALATLEQLRTPAHVFTLSANGGSHLQRITRLLFPDTPTRLNWSVPLGLLAVLCSGALLAAQVAPTPDRGPTPAMAASGDAVDSSFTTNGLFLGGWRVYTVSVTPQGRVSEIYTVNGHRSRIDARARQWIESRRSSASHLLTPPPIPALPPLPAPSNQDNGHAWRVASQSFEISAPFADGQRVYKTSTNWRGHVSESYTVSGRPAPIDAGVRKWIKDEQARSAALARVPPLPALPPLPGVKS